MMKIDIQTDKREADREKDKTVAKKCAEMK